MPTQTATIIDGRQVAAEVKLAVARDVSVFAADRGRTPGLATILVGDDPASAVYVASKRKACTAAGIASIHHELPGDVAESDLLALIDELNEDDDVSGILCQLPLPAHLDELAVVNRIVPEKDVDGLTIANAGRLAVGLDGLRPCTPSGVLALLDHAAIALSGASAVVIGRSNLFGKPVAQMLLARDATVTVCHSRTRDLADVCREADVVIAAAGRPQMVRADWIKPAATVIDVGINRTDTGLVGDVDFESCCEVAGAITPVPGGVGPMTIAFLLSNTLDAARGA